MKVVIDTNVFVAGVYWKGPPYQILQSWEKGEFKLIVSPPILTEYRRILVDLSIQRPGIKFEEALALVVLNAEVVEPVEFTTPVCRDPDDDKFLAAALSASAEYVVTGDKALLAVNGYREICVVTPKNFLTKMAKA
jgi:putative PIN family toxin of toxin-antitoxin system